MFTIVNSFLKSRFNAIHRLLRWLVSRGFAGAEDRAVDEDDDATMGTLKMHQRHKEISRKKEKKSSSRAFGFCWVCGGDGGVLGGVVSPGVASWEEHRRLDDFGSGIDSLR